MWRRILIAACLTFSVSGAVSAQEAARGAAPRGAAAGIASAKVTADLTSPGITIPQNFVGYSINTLSVVPGNYLNAANTSLINVAKLIGSNGVLRIGGGDQDTVTPPALTQGLSNDISAFASALGSGWSVIYGLDAKANDPTTAASQATMLANALGSKLTLQFGNEATDSATPEFTIAAYQTMWNSYYASVIAAVPGVNLAGPDTLGLSSDQTIINGLTPGKAGLSAITNHWYPVSTPTTWGPEALITSVNANIPNNTNTSGLCKNNTYASGTPQRLSESQNVAGGGQGGISDRLMSATWYLNEAIAFARCGWVGINSHMNLYWAGAPVVGSSYPNFYGPIQLQSDGGFAPTAEFYGLYLFSRIEGEAVVPANILAAGNQNLQAIATIGANSNANILMVNNDTRKAVVVTPGQSAAWTTASVLLLSGANCSDVAPTLGGAVIGEGGTWSGAPYTISSGATVTIPPCGAALVEILP